MIVSAIRRRRFERRTSRSPRRTVHDNKRASSDYDEAKKTKRKVSNSDGEKSKTIKKDDDEDALDEDMINESSKSRNRKHILIQIYGQRNIKK